MIAAEGEQKASRALREAANVIAESSSALQVNHRGAASAFLVSGSGLINLWPLFSIRPPLVAPVALEPALVLMLISTLHDFSFGTSRL